MADDSSIDNFRDYAEVKDAEQLVPVGPRVAPFYLRQRLPCISSMKNNRVLLNLNANANMSAFGIAFYLFKFENLPAIVDVD